MAEIASAYLFDADSVVQVVAEEGGLTAASASLGAMLATKKTATLLKRTSSLRLYRC